MNGLERNAPLGDVQAAVEAWLAANWNADACRPVEQEQTAGQSWQRRVVDAGFAVPTWPEKWHGLRLDPKRARVIEKAFAAANAPGAARDRYHLGAITVFREGSEELKREVLYDLLSGPICCLLYSEPGAGSDLAGVRTKAVRDGDGFVVDGQKVWTSDAADADYGMLLARTDWDVPKHRGITFFLFPMKQNGVDIRPINQITGESEFNEIFITEARVPARFIIGRENEGWRSFQTAIAYERLIMGQGVTGRQAGGDDGAPPLIELARRTDKLSDPVMRQRIAQALAYREVNALNNARAKEELAATGASPLMSLSKLAMSRIQHGEAAIAADLLGADAILDGPDYPDAAYANFDAAKAYMNSIGGGTDQIQRNIIAERILDLPKEPDTSKGVPFRDVRAGSG